MIHTVEISYELTKSDFNHLLQSMSVTYKNINRKFIPLTCSPRMICALNNFMPIYREGNKPCNLPIDTHYRGITYFVFKYVPETGMIYAHITLDLQSLATNTITVNLFKPTYESVQTLCMAYTNVIFALFPVCARNDLPDLNSHYQGINSLPYLPLGKICRIDYASNLIAIDDITLTLELMRKSVRTKEKAKHLDGENFQTSTKKAGKISSSRQNCYDKQEYYISKGLDEDEEFTEAIIAAENIIRYEYQRSTKKKEFALRNYYIPDFFPTEWLRSPIVYLDEEACQAIFNENYAKVIGYGNWYKRKRHTSILNKAVVGGAPLSPTKKKRMGEIRQLAAQSRSLQESAEHYISGKSIRGLKDVSGTRQTFNKYLQLYDAIGLQPYPIPDNRSLSIVHNPIRSVQEPQSVPFDERKFLILPAHVRAMVKETLNRVWYGLERKIA